jgi:hypothetical protein
MGEITKEIIKEDEIREDSKKPAEDTELDRRLAATKLMGKAKEERYAVIERVTGGKVTKDLVDKWKSEFGTIESWMYQNKALHIYRGIGRQEFQKLQKKESELNNAAMEAGGAPEDLDQGLLDLVLVESCSLYPKYSTVSLKSAPAFLASNLSKKILAASYLETESDEFPIEL